MAGALERPGQLILSFRVRGIEVDRALEFHDGFVVFVIRHMRVAEFRKDGCALCQLGSHSQLLDRHRGLLLGQQRHPQVHVSRGELRIEPNRFLEFADRRRPAPLLAVQRAQGVV